MNARQFQKPGAEDWLQWSLVIIDRLSDCVHVYKKTAALDVFMADAERQQKTDNIVKLLQRIHTLTDQLEAANAPKAAESTDEQAILKLKTLLQDTLKTLPWLSQDMQQLLKSPWFSHFPNQTAEKIFNGNGEEAEGIGSGYAEHGRLPAVITKLLECESEGDARTPRTRSHYGEPRRHDVEAHTRWNEQNKGFLRMAGRVE